MQESLVTCSSDQTLRIWDLKTSDFANPKILYDHEEEIVAADAAGTTIVSLDLEGNLLIRDVNSPDDAHCTLRLGKQVEFGMIKFS